MTCIRLIVNISSNLSFSVCFQDGERQLASGMLFWSWLCGPFFLWNEPRGKRIFLKGINKVFKNILCCAHLPVLPLICLAFSSHFFPFPPIILLLISIQCMPLCLSFVELFFFFYSQAPHIQPPPELYSAHPAALALKERPAERRQMAQHLCVGFSSTSISTCFSSFFPVRYETDHNSWPVSLLKLQSAVT